MAMIEQPNFVVRLENVCKQFKLGEEMVHAARDVPFDIEDKVFLAIAGPSGSGKSTLLNLIGCIDTPTSGRYSSMVMMSAAVPGRNGDLRSRQISFIFQTFNLFPVLTAEENVEYPCSSALMSSARPKPRKGRVFFLNTVGLSKFAKHRPNQMSGGQRQRVAIARALVTRPRIVLADEPTANLDHKTGEAILSIMQAINQAFETTFIFSTHDQRVMDMADRLVRVSLRRGGDRDRQANGYSAEFRSNQGRCEASR